MRIVYPEDWILNRIGKELEGLEGKGTYFVNYALYDKTYPRPHGAWFTHLEPAWKKKFDKVASAVDFAACPNQHIAEYLAKYVKNIRVIHHAYDPRITRVATFGVVGRTYPSGRKGEEMVASMVHEGYDVVAMGKGWPCPIIGGWEVAPDFYEHIDYLVITSTIEGGPIPLVDAIAAGVPVIAPRGVGACDEFPCIRYKKGDWDSLNAVLRKLTKPQTWTNFRRQHEELFRSSLMK